MYGFCSHFINLRFKQTQFINDRSAAQVVVLFVSSGSMKCRSLKWLLDHPTIVRPPLRKDDAHGPRSVGTRSARTYIDIIPCIHILILYHAYIHAYIHERMYIVSARQPTKPLVPRARASAQSAAALRPQSSPHAANLFCGTDQLIIYIYIYIYICICL